MRIKLLAAAVLLSTNLTGFAMNHCGDAIGTCYKFSINGGSDTQQPGVSCDNCCDSAMGDRWVNSAGEDFSCQNTPP